jgi:thiol-disulfide isomerase/thioredoxin
MIASSRIGRIAAGAIAALWVLSCAPLQQAPAPSAPAVTAAQPSAPASPLLQHQAPAGSSAPTVSPSTQPGLASKDVTAAPAADATATRFGDTLLDLARRCAGDFIGERISPPQNLMYFSAKTRRLDKRELKLGRGKITIINFWMTDCEPCRHELPALLHLQKQLSQGLRPELVFVSEDTGAEEILDFQSTSGLAFDTYVSEGGEMRKMLKIRDLPTTVLIDGAGRMTGCISGQLDSAKIDILLLLSALIASSG